MSIKSYIKLPLSDEEKSRLRKAKIKISDLRNYSADEIESLLNCSSNRAKELFALAEFQKIPSIGIKFAEDLVFMGYYSLEELRDKDGAALNDEFEQKKGYWIDPCVEDQFRLAVYFANTGDYSKNWWDFTAERKEYRATNGYPPSRPAKAWFETLEYQKKNKS
jgi:hypothetical protein